MVVVGLKNQMHTNETQSKIIQTETHIAPNQKSPTGRTESGPKSLTGEATFAPIST
jgi:hypothetical protein